MCYDHTYACTELFFYHSVFFKLIQMFVECTHLEKAKNML